jgi:hypothetical protein
LVFVTLGGMIYWFTLGRGRRFLGFMGMAFAVVLAAIVIFASCGSLGLGPFVLLTGVAVSGGVGWLGYKLNGWIPPEPSPEPILAAAMTPAPTVRALSPADVLGQWRFYVDAAACTVTIDLQPGGRYQQVVIGNSSKRNDACEGQWTLDGPNLELSAYHSATQGDTGRVRWYFGDCESGLVLFVKDDPQSAAMLIARRAAAADAAGQSPFAGDAPSSRTNQPPRKAASRSGSLFADRGRFGHGGK